VQLFYLFGSARTVKKAKTNGVQTRKIDLENKDLLSKYLQKMTANHFFAVILEK